MVRNIVRAAVAQVRDFTDGIESTYDRRVMPVVSAVVGFVATIAIVGYQSAAGIGLLLEAGVNTVLGVFGVSGVAVGPVTSIPGMAVGWLAGIIEAVGLGALLAVMGWVAGRPTVAMLAVLATGIAYWNPGKVGDEVRFGIRLVVLTIVGYILAVWIARPLVSSLGVLP